MKHVSYTFSELYTKNCKTRLKTAVWTTAIGIMCIAIGILLEGVTDTPKNAARIVLLNVVGGAFVGYGISMFAKDRSVMGLLLVKLKESEEKKSPNESLKVSA